MGIVERKLREKEQRMQEILRAARFLFKTKGFVNTTMHDIAVESELSRRTLYIYFKSKEELSYRVMKEAYELLYEKLKSSSKDFEGSGYRKLEKVGRAYLDFYQNNFDQLLFTLYFDFKINSQDINDKEALECYLIIHKIIDELIRIIREGVKDGSIRTLKNIDKTAFTAMTMIQSTMQKMAVRSDWIKEKYNYDGKEIIEETLAILLAFIRA